LATVIITDTATLIRELNVDLIVKNLGPATVYIEVADNVTPSNGYPLAPGEMLYSDGETDGLTWYGITDSDQGSATVAFVGS
jgi:hypothetical protein